MPEGALLLGMASLPAGEVHPLGINDAGDVVGFFSPAEPPSIVGGFRRSAGEFTELPEFGKQLHNVATAIDDRGTIVGRAFGGGDVVAVIWEDGGVRQITEGVLDGHDEGATAVSRNGIVVGFTDTDTFLPRAFRWVRPDEIELLPTIGGAETLPRDVNDAGVMVGFAHDDELSQALTWDQDGNVRCLLGFHDASGTSAHAVNNRGVIVGAEWTTEYSESREARLWLDGEVHRLQDLTPAVPEEYRLNDATDINDNDEVVATARLNDGGPLVTVTFLLKLDL